MRQEGEKEGSKRPNGADSQTVSEGNTRDSQSPGLPNMDIQRRPRNRAMVNRSARLFVQNLTGTERNGLLRSKIDRANRSLVQSRAEKVFVCGCEIDISSWPCLAFLPGPAWL